jgi:glycosyltransferase involved in cell wall biosynthesis
VVGLFSEYEGLPNAVCEGMACGKPILMSDVCDARCLVEDGKNGFLCDPHSPESIAKALKNIIRLTNAQLQEMGQESRRKAEILFDMSHILTAYEDVFDKCRR